MKFTIVQGIFFNIYGSFKGETYSYVYDKRQTSDSNWEFQ